MGWTDRGHLYTNTSPHGLTGHAINLGHVKLQPVINLGHVKLQYAINLGHVKLQPVINLGHVKLQYAINLGHVKLKSGQSIHVVCGQFWSVFPLLCLMSPLGHSDGHSRFITWIYG